MSILSRRSLAGAAALFAGGSVAVAAPTAVSPDASLLALVAEYQAATAEIDRLDELYAGILPPAQEAKVQRLADRLPVLVGLIALVPALTMAGLQAKAGIVRSRFVLDAEGMPHGRSPDEMVGWSFAGDVLAMA